MTYSYTGNNRLAAATGPDNATAGFQYGSGPAAGSSTMGFVKPGYTAPWLTNTSHVRLDEIGVPQEIVDHQAYADGQGYTYQYEFSPYLTYREPTLAGGTYSDALGGGGGAAYAWPIEPRAPQPGGICSPPPCSEIMPDDEINNPAYVYHQTPGPVLIAGQGGEHDLPILRLGGGGRASRSGELSLRRPPRSRIRHRSRGDHDRPRI